MGDAVCSLLEASAHSQSNCCLCLQSRQGGADKTAIHTGAVQTLVSTASVDLATPNSATLNIHRWFNFTKV